MATNLNVYRDGSNDSVTDDNPLPVTMGSDSADGAGLPPVAGRSVWRKVVIPGIGTGAAYADKDQMGTLITFPSVFRTGHLTGLLHTALYFDLDDEGLQLDLHFFRGSVTPAADNSAFAISDADALLWIGSVQFTSFYDFNTSQVSQVPNVGLVVESNDTNLYALAQARGAQNIAAGALPQVAAGILPD